MSEEAKTAKRIVVAPSTTGPMFGGQVLSVEVGPHEDVEWVWSHNREFRSAVTGYKIVPRSPEHKSAA